MEKEEVKHENSESFSQNTKENAREELKISGNDILRFIRKVFRAGNSRMAVFENEEGKRIFKINLFLLMLIFFFIPVIALIFVLILVTLDYSVSVEKKETKEKI